MKFDEINTYLDQLIRDIINNPNQSTADFFRRKAISDVIKYIKQTFKPNELVTYEKINQLPLTRHMKNKLITFMDNANEKMLVPRTQALTKLIGIGPVKAAELKSKGINTISQLKAAKDLHSTLPIETQLYLNYNPKQNIPHENIRILESYITTKNSEIAGSYRRNTRFSNDIDIILKSNKPNAIKEYIEIISRKLPYSTIKVYQHGSNKSSFLLKIPWKQLPLLYKKLTNTKQSLVYKVDVYVTSPKNYIPMLLYLTGSKSFNIIMRTKAKKMGYLLNQYGLFPLDKEGNPSSNPVQIKTEHEIFNMINMPYIAPENR